MHDVLPLCRQRSETSEFFGKKDAHNLCLVNLYSATTQRGSMGLPVRPRLNYHFVSSNRVGPEVGTRVKLSSSEVHSALFLSPLKI